MHIIGTIIIGFVAGVIAKLVTPGDHEPRGGRHRRRLRGDLPRAGGRLVWARPECRFYRSYRGRGDHTSGLGTYSEIQGNDIIICAGHEPLVSHGQGPDIRIGFVRSSHR